MRGGLGGVVNVEIEGGLEAFYLVEGCSITKTHHPPTLFLFSVISQKPLIGP